ncbi:hypothetical protein AO944_16890 [Pseudomonas aeruginosa]|nr:hypothetical protein HV95_15435 [Pseudomonas aeruginosa]KSF82989.1 hypothetical protein AO944_16890 [Pseudomonas aeruginosa]OVZ02859.1 hypothetical protein CDO37_26835 [Pseudomonas aeruginosa]OWJ22444.1 hypothetical protein CDC04_06230 [Pseudomonas aeruginosa]PBX40209.1 hypothetical protein CJT80_21210 [Pseudomonas aeruginosa]
MRNPIAFFKFLPVCGYIISSHLQFIHLFLGECKAIGRLTIIHIVMEDAHGDQVFDLRIIWVFPKKLLSQLSPTFNSLRRQQVDMRNTNTLIQSEAFAELLKWIYKTAFILIFYTSSL